MHRAAGRSWWVAFEGARLSLTFKKKNGGGLGMKVDCVQVLFRESFKLLGLGEIGGQSK